MSVGSSITGRRCTVVGSERLPGAVGGGNALCGTIERTIAARTTARDYRISVNVVSASRLSAALVVNGRSLPEQRFSVMDRSLSPSSVQHFADSLAALITEAAQK